MTLNEYITQNAGKINELGFLKQFMDSEVFFPITEPSAPLVAGSTVPAGTQLRFEVAKLEAGRMAVLYATKDDQRLVSPFGGLSLRKAIEMMCALEDIDGILIRNDRDDWFAGNKAAMLDVLEA